jgi:hypothetical protein
MRGKSPFATSVDVAGGDRRGGDWNLVCLGDVDALELEEDPLVVFFNFEVSSTGDGGDRIGFGGLADFIGSGALTGATVLAGVAAWLVNGACFPGTVAGV